MKNRFFACALLGFVFAFNANAGELRVIGTNLVDFSTATPITGQVVKIYPQAITLKLTNGFHYRAIYPDWAKQEISRPMGSADLYQLQQIQNYHAWAARIATFPPADQIKAYNDLASSPVADFLQPEPTIIYIQLLHPPPATIDQQISFLAIPLKKTGYWDCGIVATNQAAK